ncbi:PilZ domain-containing protein [Marinobacteraceae bacterium S3BR75-40.1]
MTQPQDERRHFSRILFDAYCRLHQGERVWPAQVLDISLKGILLKEPEGFDGDQNLPFEVTIELAEQGAAIVMAVKLKHREKGQLGFHCEFIDLESAAHLRRLVELNLGDDQLLHRELQVLGEGE